MNHYKMTLYGANQSTQINESTRYNEWSRANLFLAHIEMSKHIDITHSDGLFSEDY